MKIQNYILNSLMLYKSALHRDSDGQGLFYTEIRAMHYYRLCCLKTYTTAFTIGLNAQQNLKAHYVVFWIKQGVKAYSKISIFV